MAPPSAQLWHEVGRQGRLIARTLRQGAAALAGSAERTRHERLGILFRGVNAWLREAGGDYWIVYGTLLGWHREGAILARDTDVDFGVPESSYARLRERRALLPSGFRLFDTSAKHGGPKLYVCHRGWEADIYFFRSDGERLTTILRSNLPSDTLPFPRSWFYPPKPATFLGEETFVPDRPELYLHHLYGYIGPDAVLDRRTGLYRPRDGCRGAGMPDTH